MATIIRCDICKRLNDESNVGYIGRKWDLKKNRTFYASLHFYEDVCETCVKELVAKNAVVATEQSDD